MMLTGLQTSSKTLPLDGTLGKSQSVDAENGQPVSFGEVLKLKEKQLQQEQEVNSASIAAALAALQTMSLATPLPLPQIETVETNETTIPKTESTQSALDVVPQASTPPNGFSDSVASTSLTAARLTPTESADPFSQKFSNTVSESLAQPITSQAELFEPQLVQTESSKTHSSSVIPPTKVENTAFVDQNFATTAIKPTSTIKQVTPSIVPPTSKDITTYSTAQIKSARSLQFEPIQPQASPEITSAKVDSFVNQTVTANVMKAAPTIKEDLPSAILNASEAIGSFATPIANQVATQPQAKSDTTIVDKEKPLTPELQTDLHEKAAEAFTQSSTIKMPIADEIPEVKNNVTSPVALTIETNSAPIQDLQTQVQTAEFTTQPIESLNDDKQPTAEASTSTSFPQPEITRPIPETSSPQNVMEDAVSKSKSAVVNIPLGEETPSVSQPQVTAKAVELPKKPVEVPVAEVSESIQDLKIIHEVATTQNNVSTEVTTAHANKTEVEPAQIQGEQFPVAAARTNTPALDQKIQPTSNPSITSPVAHVLAEPATNETSVVPAQAFSKTTDHEPLMSTNQSIATSQDAKQAESIAPSSEPPRMPTVTTDKPLNQPEMVKLDSPDISTSASMDLNQTSPTDVKSVELKNDTNTLSVSRSETIDVKAIDRPTADQKTVAAVVDNFSKLATTPVVSQEATPEYPVSDLNQPIKNTTNSWTTAVESNTPGGASSTADSPSQEVSSMPNGKPLPMPSTNAVKDADKAKESVQITRHLSNTTATNLDTITDKPVTPGVSFQIKIDGEDSQPIKTITTVQIEHGTTIISESNSMETESPNSMSAYDLITEKPVVSEILHSTGATRQPAITFNDVESDTSMTKESSSQISNISNLVDKFSEVVENASTVEQPIINAGERQAQKLEKQNEVIINVPMQAKAQPVVETQSSIKQSSPASAVDVTNDPKVVTDAKQVTPLQIEQQSPQINQEKIAVETHPVTESVEQVSVPVPTVLDADTESAVQEQTQTTTNEGRQQLPQAEIKIPVETEENVLPTEVTQPHEVSQPVTNNSLVKAEIPELAVNSVQNKDTEKSQSVIAQVEPSIPVFETSTMAIPVVQEPVLPQVMRTVPESNVAISTLASNMERELPIATNEVQVKKVEWGIVPEPLAETASQSKPESVKSSVNMATETKANTQQVTMEAKVNLEKPIAANQLESNTVSNQVDIKTDEVKASTVEPKEKPTLPTPSASDVVVPSAAKPNISTVKDTVKVKQAGKDEDTPPVEKQPKLNQMPGSVVAATGPNKEAVAVDRSASNPSTLVNAQAVEVVQQVIRHFNSNLKADSNTMHLQLNPKELGAIDIQMVSNAQGVHVSFVAEQAGTSKLLETQLPQLRESLTAAGVQLSGLDISQHNQSGQKGGGFSQEPNAAPWPNEIFVEENQSVLETSTAERRFGQSSEVDYRV